jgi:hypothetical protein
MIEPVLGVVAVTFTHRLGFPKTAILDGASDVTDTIAYNNILDSPGDLEENSLSGSPPGGALPPWLDKPHRLISRRRLWNG